MKFWKKLTIVLVSALGLSALTTGTVRADTHTDFIDQMSQPVLKVSRQNHLYGSVMMLRPHLRVIGEPVSYQLRRTITLVSKATMMAIRSPCRLRKPMPAARCIIR